MLNEKLLTEALGELGDRAPRIFLYEKTDSTNTRAREYAREHPENKSPVIFIAESQSAGRGRRGRSFVSEGGVGIYMSLLLYPEKRGADATKITAEAAVALADAIKELSSLCPRIKWVNDIYAGGKKLAGILTEAVMSSDGEISCLVLGMGINVYKTAYPEEISSIATSIEEECNERISRELLVFKAVKNLLSDGIDESEILRKYRESSLLIGEEIAVLPLSGEPYFARALEILDDYSLSVEREDGKKERLFTGEVSIKTSAFQRTANSRS